MLKAAKKMNEKRIKLIKYIKQKSHKIHSQNAKVFYRFNITQIKNYKKTLSKNHYLN